MMGNKKHYADDSDDRVMGVYLKRDESGVMLPCDKDGNLLGHVNSLTYTVGIGEISTVTMTVYLCGILSDG